MTDGTPLDQAYQARLDTPEAEEVHLRFFQRLADAELFLALVEESNDGDILPQVAQVDDQPYVLAFDLHERLADFAGQATAYAALPGRSLAQMLEGQNLGIALNPQVAPSSSLIEPDQIEWLCDMLNTQTDELMGTLQEVAAPGPTSQATLEALDGKLAQMGGLAQRAYLITATYDDGAQGQMMAVIDPMPGAEPALAQGLAQAVAFAPTPNGPLDVAFFTADDPVAERIARVGLAFDLPQPQERPAPVAPGSDPEKPPILR